MREVTAIYTILERLGFTREAACYMTRACNVDSLDEVKWMDGEDNVENMTKRVNRPSGTFTVGSGADAVTTPNVGLQVLRAENNLKLCVYFLKHMEGYTMYLMRPLSHWKWYVATVSNKGMKRSSRKMRLSQRLMTNIGLGPWKVSENTWQHIWGERVHIGLCDKTGS
jgi:hypothetical protein